MKIKVELCEKDLKAIVLKKFEDEMPNTSIVLEDVKIFVKSKQNYKSEWEEAEFKAVIEKIGI